MANVISRRLEAIVGILANEEPVVALQGPRAVGKTTLLRAIAATKRVGVVGLDDVATREAAAADPATFVSGPPPVCIDEYQRVPALLDAMKAELNQDGSPGRFIITGSTRHDALPMAAQALTGRLHLVTIHPLSQGEIGGTRENLVAAIFGDFSKLLSPDPSSSSRDEYIRRVVMGGLPIALGRNGTARNRWFDDYVTLSLERDVEELSKIRQRRALPGLLRRLARQTAQRNRWGGGEGRKSGDEQGPGGTEDPQGRTRRRLRCGRGTPHRAPSLHGGGPPSRASG